VEKEQQQRYNSQYGYPLMDVVASSGSDAGVVLHNIANYVSAAVRTARIRFRSRHRRVKKKLSAAKERLSLIRNHLSLQISISLRRDAPATGLSASFDATNDGDTPTPLQQDANRPKRSVGFAVDDADGSDKEEAGQSSRLPFVKPVGSMMQVEAIKEERRRKRRVSTLTLQRIIADVVENARQRRLLAAGDEGKKMLGLASVGRVVTAVRKWKRVRSEAAAARGDGSPQQYDAGDIYSQLQDAIAVLSLNRLQGNAKPPAATRATAAVTLPIVPSKSFLPSPTGKGIIPIAELVQQAQQTIMKGGGYLRMTSSNKRRSSEYTVADDNSLYSPTHGSSSGFSPRQALRNGDDQDERAKTSPSRQRVAVERASRQRPSAVLLRHVRLALEEMIVQLMHIREEQRTMFHEILDMIGKLTFPAATGSMLLRELRMKGFDSTDQRAADGDEDNFSSYVSDVNTSYDSFMASPSPTTRSAEHLLLDVEDISQSSFHPTAITTSADGIASQPSPYSPAAPATISSPQQRTSWQRAGSGRYSHTGPDHELPELQSVDVSSSELVNESSPQNTSLRDVFVRRSTYSSILQFSDNKAPWSNSLDPTEEEESIQLESIRAWETSQRTLTSQPSTTEVEPSPSLPRRPAPLGLTKRQTWSSGRDVVRMSSPSPAHLTSWRNDYREYLTTLTPLQSADETQPSTSASSFVAPRTTSTATVPPIAAAPAAVAPSVRVHESEEVVLEGSHAYTGRSWTRYPSGSGSSVTGGIGRIRLGRTRNKTGSDRSVTDAAVSSRPSPSWFDDLVASDVTTNESVRKPDAGSSSGAATEEVARRVNSEHGRSMASIIEKRRFTANSRSPLPARAVVNAPVALAIPVPDPSTSETAGGSDFKARSRGGKHKKKDWVS
jgi:hypothetical protein